MKYLLLTIVLLFPLARLVAQSSGETMEGKVSYVTSQNVYVKFQSTANISEGDTLWSKETDRLAPAMIVRSISSISVVCTPLTERKWAVSDQLYSRGKGAPAKPAETPVTVTEPTVIPPVAKMDTAQVPMVQPKKRTQLITGRVSVSSYSNFSNQTSNTQRMRYSFSLNALNIADTKLSGEAYIDFVHRWDQWSEIKADVFNGLKIYCLDLNYEFNKSNKIWLGRKINPRISNMGAIDGLQYELKLHAFTIGLVGGFRPDYKDYGFDASLLQYGAYVGHDYANKNGSMQTTLAFVEQMNQGKTDRRFAYLQHSNALVKNLYFFGSVEVGLYQKVMNPVDSVQKDTTYKKESTPTLSNLYLSLRYRPIRQLSLGISYSALKNIIYYETYPQNILQRLLDVATIQGFMLQVSAQPVKYLSIGVNVGYRDSKNDPRPTKNFYGYVTYSRIPALDISATVSATILTTGYVSGNIYSVELSRDLLKGKLFLGLNYRYVDYRFVSDQGSDVQNVGEFNLTWRILKKTSCSFYYEGTFDKISSFNRLYINLTQRF
jgi:hypothetical protein